MKELIETNRTNSLNYIPIISIPFKKIAIDKYVVIGFDFSSL